MNKRRVVFLSIVIGSVLSKTVLMSADRRAVNKDGTFQENFSKIFKVNKNVLIGFTGSASVSKILNENNFFKRDNDIKPIEYAKEIFNILGKGQVNKETNIMILGKETEVDSYFSLFTTVSTKIEVEKIISNDEILNFVMPPADLAESQDEINKSFRSRISHLINIGDLSSTSIINEQHKFIDEISRVSESVNVKWETLTI